MNRSEELIDRFLEARRKGTSIPGMLNAEQVLTAQDVTKFKRKKATIGPYDFLSKALSATGPNALFWKESMAELSKTKMKFPPTAGLLIVVGVDEKSPKKVYAFANKKRQFFTQSALDKLRGSKKENFGLAGAPGGVRDDPESPNDYGDTPGSDF